MDETRFDTLTRSFAIPSRRSLLAALGTALGVAHFGGDAVEETLAKRKKRRHAKTWRRASHDRLEAERRKKKKRKKKKPAATVPPATVPPPSSSCGSCDDGIACTTDSCDAGNGTCAHTPNDSLCTSANPCLSGRCDPSNQTADQNGCVFDPITGGTLTCGRGACERSVQRCVNGVEQPCVPGQPSPEICDGIDNDCNGVIDNGFDLQNDLENCGQCGRGCTFENGTGACIEGQCYLQSCHAGFGDCDANQANGCETNLANDAEGCGTCGLQCASDQTCDQFRCKPTTPCHQTCPEECLYCFHRAEGGTFCGDNWTVDCTRPCSADADCGVSANASAPISVNAITYRCILSYTHRSTNGTTPNSCGGLLGGFCTLIQPCA